MATFENRRGFTVSVKHRDDLFKTFPYNKPAQARAYLLELRARGFKPRLDQLENAILVRVRCGSRKLIF